MALAWSTAAAALLLSSWYAGHDRTTGEGVIASRTKTPHLLLAWVLAHIFQCAFIFGGGVTVVVGAAFTVAVTPAIIVENTGALGRLRRSMRLTRSDFGRSIGYVIVTGMLVLIILPALGLIP